MINRLDATAADFEQALASLQRPPAADVVATTTAIINRVRDEGDAALLSLTAQFEHSNFATAADLWVPSAALAAALASLSPQLAAALEAAAGRVRAYHQRQKPQSWRHTDAVGNMVGERLRPVARAAVYVPGGQAAYPSSALMGVIPAKIAGVGEVVLITPPAAGVVSPVTLAAAAVAGADRVLMLGGAQAVAAAAFGTQTIARADVIVGPGNVFVTEAKRQLYGCIGIDSLAGPSEVLIISDDTSDPRWVAADLIAQAEHATDAQSIAVSPSGRHLQAVAAALNEQIPQQPRAAIIAESLAARGALITAPDIAACCRIANHMAAEHVQVMCADAAAVAERIDNAGGLFIGAHACVPLGDYGAGPNHILPTAQTARFASPLGVGIFYKRSGVLQVSASGVAALAQTAAALAEAEGLFAHAAAAKARMS